MSINLATQPVQAADLLAALAGSTPQAPMALFQIAGRLPGLSDPHHIAAALADLVARCAVGTARLSADGRQWREVYWLTGAAPTAVPWRAMQINGHTQDDARAARLAQCPAEETHMKKPPKNPAPGHAKAPQGAVRAEILNAVAGLTRAEALTVQELAERCHVAKNLSTVAAVARVLSEQGQIGHDITVRAKRVRALYWDHNAEAAPSMPEPQPGELHGLAWQPSESDEPARFGLYDDGTLEIWRGSEFLQRFDLDETQRLRELLAHTDTV